MGSTRPNPAVGAVIVHKNKIIGEGFTAPYGGNHAEVNAVNSVKNKALLKEATVYVTLEPCSHFGKTPPCADLLVKHQVKQVVIGCIDTHSLVAGQGIEKLKNADIKVVVGVLEEECRAHHKRFFTMQEKERPFIILKWAATRDGYIAPMSKEELKPVFISNTYSQQLVHKLRSKEHAILVGTKTVLVDNPKLNVRSWSGENPVRVILDRSLKITDKASVLDGSIKTIVITENKLETTKLERFNRINARNVFLEKADFSENLAAQICTILQQYKIQSLIVEGGRQTLQTFIDENLWDEAFVFIGNAKFKNGIKAPVLNTAYVTQTIKNDILKIYKND